MGVPAFAVIRVPALLHVVVVVRAFLNNLLILVRQYALAPELKCLGVRPPMLSMEVLKIFFIEYLPPHGQDPNDGYEVRKRTIH